MTPPTFTPAILRLMSVETSAGGGYTCDLIQNKTTISPDIRCIRQPRSSLNSMKTIRVTSLRYQSNFDQMDGTLRSISSPMRGTTKTREQRKPAMPEHHGQCATYSICATRLVVVVVVVVFVVVVVVVVVMVVVVAVVALLFVP